MTLLSDRKRLPSISTPASVVDRSRVALGPAAVLVIGLAVALAACGGTESGTDRPPVATAPGEAAPVAPAGDAVPALEVESFDGGTVSLTDYSGRPLVVNFWASWCPPCIAEMPDLESVHRATSGEVAFVGVNTQDTPDRAAELVDETGVTYDLVRDPDGELARAFEVFGMPSTFYVDADGVIVGRHTGLLTRDALADDLHEHFGVEISDTA